MRVRINDVLLSTLKMDVYARHDITNAKVKGKHVAQEFITIKDGKAAKNNGVKKVNRTESICVRLMRNMCIKIQKNNVHTTEKSLNQKKLAIEDICGCTKTLRNAYIGRPE